MTMTILRRESYPKALHTFELQGGIDGNLELQAVSEDTLEMRLGDDYVELSRRDARKVIEVLGRWLESVNEPDVVVVISDTGEPTQVMIGMPRERRG